MVLIHVFNFCHFLLFVGCCDSTLRTGGYGFSKLNFFIGRPSLPVRDGKATTGGDGAMVSPQRIFYLMLSVSKDWSIGLGRFGVRFPLRPLGFGGSCDSRCSQAFKQVY